MPAITDPNLIGENMRGKRVKNIGIPKYGTDAMPFAIPNYTTAERDALDTVAEGMLIWNTTNDRINYYDGTQWLDYQDYYDYPTLRVGDINGGDYTEIETDGTIEMNGAATVWEDLNFDVERAGAQAGSQPDYVVINNCVYREFTSANNQFCGAGAELPHSYKLGATIYPHLHLFLKSGESAGTTGVTFTFYWELRRGGESITTGSVTLSATSAQLTANPGLFDIYDDTGFSGCSELDGQLNCSLYRTGGNAGDIIVTTFGVHYEKDTIGSRQLSTK